MESLFERVGGGELVVVLLACLLVYFSGLDRLRARILGRRRGR